MDDYASITSSGKINITGFGNMAYMCIHASNPTTQPYITKAMNIVKQMLRVEIAGGTTNNAQDVSTSTQNNVDCSGDSSGDDDDDSGSEYSEED